MFDVYEVYEYLGTKELRASNLSEDEANKFIKDNSKMVCSNGEGIVYMSGSYCWYLQKFAR